MKLKTEQIIKALECCSSRNPKCEDCPCYGDSDACWSVNEKSIALIRELIEENARLQTDYNELYESTTEEIKRLKSELEKRPPRLIITKKSG